jgi:putative ABC transport system permease protein
MNYILTAIANLSRRAKMAGVHKCYGAEAGNIMSMFLIETSLIVLISLLVAAFLILNCADLIKEVLSSSLAGLFTWHTLWVPLLCICIVLLIGGCIPGYIYAKIPATQAFRRYTDGKKGWTEMSHLERI